MKAFVSIFLICYFSLAALVPRMDVDRLQQIPDLVAHYLEHTEMGDATNAIDFISHHYGKNSTEPSDGHNLPFQGHDCSVVSYIFATFISDAIGSLSPNHPQAKLLDTYAFHFTTNHISDIWQPPRA